MIQSNWRNITIFYQLSEVGKSGIRRQRCTALTVSSDTAKAFTEPSVLEKAVDFDKEIAVIVARNANGEIAVFPPVELVFHPVHHLVEYLFAPAQISI
jgi:5-(carboxyamino)imidazole ribonucleotide synthase